MWLLNRHGRNHRSLHLHEVVLHVTLEVEVGETIAGGETEKSAQLGVGIDLATVLLVLQLVGADVVVDLLAHLGSGQLRTRGLAQKLGKFIADKSGANKARRLAVAGALVLAVRHLLGGLVGLQDRLLEDLELGLEGSEEGSALVDLVTERSKEFDQIVGNDLLGNSTIHRGGGRRNGRNGSHDLSGLGSSNLLGGSRRRGLLDRGLLRRSGGGCGGNRSGRGGLLGCSYHLMEVYIIL